MLKVPWCLLGFVVKWSFNQVNIHKKCKPFYESNEDNGVDIKSGSIQSVIIRIVNLVFSLSAFLIMSPLNISAHFFI